VTVADWLKSAVADAERRGLPQLKALLQGLAQSTTQLRNLPIGDRAHDR
jgi:hypothetical protein